jgi:signal transduction histidine kinase
MPTLSRRWAWVVVPMLGVLALEALQHAALQRVLAEPLHLLLVATVLLAGALVVAGALFRRFDRMTAELSAQKEELEARGNANAALQRVSLVVSALRDLDPILDTVSEQARLLLGGDVSLLCLADDEGSLGPRSRSGPREAFHPGPESCSHPDGRGGLCPLLMATVEYDPGTAATAPLCRFVDPAYLGSSVAVPLRVGERVLGTLAVSATTSRRFGALELATLESLASVAAVAIDNARLYRRVHELGMVEERNRIARELHDGLAQVLAYVGTKSEAAVSLLDSGHPAEARAQLVDLGSAARSVYVDVREAILGLSSPLEPGQGVVPAVREFAAQYADAAKLPTRVIASPDAEAARLAPAAEAQALRVLQEALTNVRKHAVARRVVVEAKVDGDELLLEVRDDGQGFDPSAVPASDWPHFGIATMRERATSVGGRLEISSQPGSGTAVRLRLPIAAEA